MKIKKWVALLLCAGIIITQTGCGSEEPVSDNQFCLDTICTITVYDMKKSKAEEMIAQAFEACKKYEAILSKTAEGSDVYKLNKAKGKAVEVQPETLEVIKRGIQYGEQSQGAFDITIGAVTELWDFTGENPKVPEAKALKAAVDTVDYRQIHVDGRKVSMKNPEAQMDLGGIAKGYIADRLTEQLEELGAERAIINLGGNIAALGEKEEGVPWKIGIERPYSNRSEILGSVQVSNGTIVTSGVYERYFEAGGKTYHHILDPKTGYPVQNQLDAVTIKGKKGQSMDCDALGTICLMLGTEKSIKLLEKMEGIQAAFIDKQDKVTKTKGLEITPAE